MSILIGLTFLDQSKNITLFELNIQHDHFLLGYERLSPKIKPYKKFPILNVLIFNQCFCVPIQIISRNWFHQKVKNKLNML